MQRILSIAGSIGTPIALAALAILVFYGVFKLLLENKLLAAVHHTESAKIIRAVVNWIGLLALVTVILVLIPAVFKLSDEKKTGEVSQLYASLVFDLTNHRYGDANEVADQILEISPNNMRALSAKGMIKFYDEQYREATSYFRKALKQDPTNRILQKNLADALVEIGAFEESISLYKSADDGQSDAALALGRAYLCAGDFDQATAKLQGVPNTIERGHARVLEAAAIAAKRGAASTDEVKAKLKLVVNTYPEYWNGILSGQQRDIHQSFSCVLKYLKPYITGTSIPAIATLVGEDDTVELRDHH